MDALILSRIQFGLSVGVHFLFPVTTLGLAFYIVVVEGLFWRTGNEIYKNISTLSTKILGLIFAMGVASGLILPFAFGTNWSGFVNFVGSVFGIHLTVEAVVAFMLESIFLGVLLFGRSKVSRGFYFWSAFLVFLGSHLSAFFIISANSWMQTPFHSLADLAKGIPVAGIDGFHLQQLADGSYKVVMDDVLKVIFNPSVGIRFLHTITACWICGAVLMAGITGYFFLKHKHTQTARRAFTIAVIIGSITAVAQPFIGHEHIMEVLKWQPAKNAAMEGIFKTQTGAPLYAVGVTDAESGTTQGIALPGILSLLEGYRFDTEVKGLNEVIAQGQAGITQTPKVDEYMAYSPPVQTIFQLFRVMIWLGTFMVIGMLIALFMIWRKIWTQKWVWIIMLVMIPMPYVAVEGGWITAEIGRQPWVVYGLMKTSEAVSSIPTAYVGFSLVIFILVYISIGFMLIRWLPRIIRDGLEEHVAHGPSIVKEA